MMLVRRCCWCRCSSSFSCTSCPWDLAEFGGARAYVLALAAGRGRRRAGPLLPVGPRGGGVRLLAAGISCGAAPAAAARAPGWRWCCGAGRCSAGAQLLRGAHFPSHTLWSAWLCWTISATAAHLPRAARKAAASRVSARSAPAHPGHAHGPSKLS
ncbi:MAG: hypothetical protein MZW92_34625 [Comamonadaceae bacterium]|nr:hypothetical protein [Comamonadaceae bacterium]